ncbi:VWA domain-containing protein [Dokdonella soli]|uniref:VWA domain-containing protein n=1 Tax=Dokdonella soli TaxID=529810 RepID=A0ABP3TVF5_9GAMM
MLELAWPWLLAILPLPFIAVRLLPRACGLMSTALHLPHLGVALPQQADVSPVPRLRRVLALFAWALLALAAARPQWLGTPEDVPRSGRDLLLAVDCSGSMSIEDMQLGGQPAPRFAAIQAIGADFIQRRAGDRVGLILFGTRAYLLVPLTFDLKTVGKQLADATIGLAGRETAIGDAVGLAVKRLRDRPQQQRVMVLLTDGVNTSGELDPVKAIDLATANHVRIYTIGIGADAMRVNSLFGSRVINPSADLDEKMLGEMAAKTGGHYFRARNSEELADVYRTIDKLEPAADAKQSLRPVDELYWLPLAGALAAGAFAFLLPVWRVRLLRRAVST